MDSTDDTEYSTRSRKLTYGCDGMPVQCREWQLEYQQGTKTPDGDQMSIRVKTGLWLYLAHDRVCEVAQRKLVEAHPAWARCA